MSSMSFETPLYSSTRTDIVFFNDVNIALPAALTQYGPYYCGNVDALKAAITNIAGGGALLRWAFYADQELTMFMGSHLASVRTGIDFDMSWAVMGAWVIFEITPTAAVTVSLRLSTNSRPGKPYGNSNNNTLIGMAAPAAVGAGATITHTTLRTYPGAASWSAGYVANDAGAWEAFLESVSQAGTVQVLDYAHSADGRICRPVWLPARTVQIRIHNLDAGAAHNYLVALTADPGLW